MGASRLKILISAVAVLFVAGLATWGFISGRQEAAHEADAEHAIQAPQRVSTQNGEPVITLDAAAQSSNGITTVRLNRARYPQPLRAFGTVLDLQALTDLSNNSANARAQVEASRAKLAASQTAFERAQDLYKDEQNMSAAQVQAAEAAFRTEVVAPLIVAVARSPRLIADTARSTNSSIDALGSLRDFPPCAETPRPFVTRQWCHHRYLCALVMR